MRSVISFLGKNLSIPRKYSPSATPKTSRLSRVIHQEMSSRSSFSRRAPIITNGRKKIAARSPTSWMRKWRCGIRKTRSGHMISNVTHGMISRLRASAEGLHLWRSLAE